MKRLASPRRRAVILAVATGTATVLATGPQAVAATPPAQFVGTGTTYWDYLGNDGTGDLVVTVNQNEPGLAPNQADVIYAFDSGTQPFFANFGQIVVTGSWATGWDATTTAPSASHVHIGPFGNGTNIPFSINGGLVTQDGGFSQGPWEVEGSFTPVSTGG